MTSSFWKSEETKRNVKSAGLWFLSLSETTHFLGNLSRLEEEGQYLDKGVQCGQVLKSLLALPKG